MGIAGRTAGGRTARGVAVDALAAILSAPMATAALSVAGMLVVAGTAPDVALADNGSAFSAENAMTLPQRIQNFIRYLFLPIGIAWASWQIIYIALVCGVIGIDPLNLLGGNLDQDRIWLEVRNRFRNFAKGLAWVAGVWMMFEAVLFLVSNLVGVIEQNFG